MRKGRHRRHRDARDLKRGVLLPTTSRPENTSVDVEPDSCEECQRYPHAEWCMADADDLED